MNRKLAALLAGALAVCLSGCIYVRVKGNLSESGLVDDDEDFRDLTNKLDTYLQGSEYHLDISASLWSSRATWIVAFEEEGSDPEAAFRCAQEAVRQRVQREGGRITSESSPEQAVSASEGAATSSPRHTRWSCTFEIDDEPGEASVELGDHRGDERRPQQLEIRWKEAN